MPVRRKGKGEKGRKIRWKGGKYVVERNAVIKEK